MRTPTSTIFLTGLTGHLGACLRRRLALSPRGWTWRALVRRPDEVQPEPGFTSILGDFTTSGDWTNALDGVDTVVHMGALTGKASRKEHFRVNFEGTRHLVRVARDRGVRRFLFVSSVAAGFNSLERYPYGAAKKAAEDAVLEAGFDTLILRSTLIGGRRAPAFEALRRLAGLPIVPLFGGGTGRVQPIHGDDLADVLLDALAADRFTGETLAVGGREQLSMAELVERLAERMKGRPPHRISIPLASTSLPLRCMEALLGGGRLPLTEGQLMSFVQDGVAENPPWVESFLTHDIESMVAEACGER